MCKIVFALFALLAVANAASLPAEPIPILRQVQDSSPEGSYNTEYETGNGIVYREQGVVKSDGKESHVVSQGSYSYPSEDGSAPIAVTWVADENGFQAQGDHLPVAPPTPEIPVYIARALEWIKDHPYVEPKEQ